MRLVLFSVLLILHGAFSTLELELPDRRKVFNPQFFQALLDPELCQEQLAFLANNHTMLLGQFLDAGLRVPKGVLQGNLYDLGNYYQCLSINEEFPEWTIQGKHCAVEFPFVQNITLSEKPWLETLLELPWPELKPETSIYLKNLNLKKLKKLRKAKETFESISRSTPLYRVEPDSPLADFSLQLAVCIPKTCTPEQFLDSIVNISLFGVQYDELYCRFPNDKQWVAGEYVAIAIFAFLGLLVSLSTCYDIHQKIVLRSDPKSLNKIYQSFSVYTNTHRLVTYTPLPGAIECLDGIRALAMMWVIVCHTYNNQTSLPIANPMDITNWIPQVNAIWITLGPINVDTFFLISGLLLIYTTAVKFRRWKLLKTLHLFYLNRLLRIFPILAAFILIQASFLSRMADGPDWFMVELQTENCRLFWWSTLLHIHNWVNPAYMCLPQTWYLAVEIQLYILSPIVLIWVFGCRKTSAWTALIGSFLLILTASTIYCFVHNFASWPTMPSRSEEDSHRYLQYYYFHTLARAPPFIVGMLYGYLMHIYRGQQVILSKIVLTSLWACAVFIYVGITFTCYLCMQNDWDNQIADNFINSFIRPSWAIAIGWMVFACHHGYGGPINWVLSLRAWKVLSRLSYAMYITHFTLIFFVDSTAIAPRYFSPSESVFKFIAHFGLSAVVSFILTLLVDSPFSILVKLAMGREQRRPRPREIKDRDKDKKRQTSKWQIGIANEAYEADDSNGKVQL